MTKTQRVAVLRTLRQALSDFRFGADASEVEEKFMRETEAILDEPIDPITETCPTCKAGPGMRCLTRPSKKGMGNNYHVAREARAHE